MKREFVGAMALALALGLGARDTAAQAIRVDVGINAPPVAARVMIGEPAYRVREYYPHRDWVRYGPYAEAYRRHDAWVAYELRWLRASYMSPREYRKALRAFERERAKRERDLERAYQRWLYDRYDGHRGRGHAYGRR